MRLLSIDEKYRSQFLYDQIESFEEKVYRSYEQFNVEFLYRMYSKLLKKTVVDTRKVKTLGHLRKCHKDFQKLLKCKRTHRNIVASEEEEALVNYFVWFFQFWDYLRHLRYNFIDRIFTPLFRYFYHVGYDRPEREDTTDSATSSPSVMSLRSYDSGVSDLSGLTSVLGGDYDRLSQSLSATSGIEETQRVRKKIVTRNALLALSKEFQDIKKLYDTTEIEKLAQRLSHLKDRTDQLLDQEGSLDKDLLSQDSERAVFNLKIKEIGSYNVMRLVPDVLQKFQKAAWLARRWLEQDDEKTKDLNAKLGKLTNLEEQMNRRLSALSSEIRFKENELESHADMIGTLLQKEERSSNLSESMMVLKQNECVLKDKMESLNTEKEELSEKLNTAVEKNDRKTYRNFRPLYDKNKLQRFALERQIASLNYHINILESDINVELEVKADVIHTTNDMQDKCEELEQRLEKAKREKRAIQAALIPISQDRKYVSEQIQIQNGLDQDENDDEDDESNDDVFRADYINSRRFRNGHQETYDNSDNLSHADYIRSRRYHNNEEHRLVDLEQEFLAKAKQTTGKDVSFFITSLPGERSVNSDEHQMQNLRSPRQPLKKLSPNQSVSQHTFVNQPMKTLSPVQPMKVPQYTPEVVASEW